MNERSAVLRRRDVGPAPASPESAPLRPAFLASPASAAPRLGHTFNQISPVRPQPKLTVNRPGDKYEQEADSVADQVMRMGGGAAALSQDDGQNAEKEEMQRTPLPRTLDSVLQRAEEGEAQATDVSGIVQQGLSGGGQPLDGQTRSFMEPRFGHDFSQVRIHTDASASQSANQVAARAYTVGNDIAFRSGDFHPGSSDGKRLIAHELTHVVQQGGASPRESVVHREPDVKSPIPNDKVSVPAFTRPAAGAPYDKNVFLQLCGQATTRILEASLASKAWMLSLAIAYGAAWTNHTARLKDQADLEKLQDDLILGAALAFVPGGVGGVVGAAMKNATKSDFIIDGVKDLAKFGLRSTGNVALPAAVGGAGASAASGLKAFPIDPLTWQDQVDMRLNSELLVATQALSQWQNNATNDPDFQMDFDPVAVTDNALKINGSRMTDLKPEDHASLALNYEKGFWAKWLETYGYKLALSGEHYYAKDNVGKKVKNRCEELGLNVDQYASVAKARVNEDDRVGGTN